MMRRISLVTLSTISGCVLLGAFAACRLAGATNDSDKPRTELAPALATFSHEFDRDVVLAAWLQDARRAGGRLAAYRSSSPAALPAEDWAALEALGSRYRDLYPLVSGPTRNGLRRTFAETRAAYRGFANLQAELADMTSSAIALGDRSRLALARWQGWFAEHGAKRAPAWEAPDLSGAPPGDNSILLSADGKCARPLFGGDYRNAGGGSVPFADTRLLQYDYQIQVYDGVTWNERGSLLMGDESVFGAGTDRNLALALILSYSNHGFVFSPRWLRPALRTDPNAFVAPWAIASQAPILGRFEFLNVHHPLVHDALLTYLDSIARQYRSDRRVLYYQGPWEATDGLRGIEGGRDAQSLAAFRDFLKSRYGDVRRLNKAWHSHHSSFNSLQPTAQRSVPNTRPEQALNFEFEAWRQSRFMAWWAEGYRRLKGGDPTHPVGADSNVPLFNADVTSGVDYWRLPDAGDIVSIHSGLSDELTERYLYSLRRYRPEKTAGMLEYIWNAPECWKNPSDPVAFAAGERNFWRSAALGIRIWNIYGQNDTYVPCGSVAQLAYNNLADFGTDYSMLRPCAGVIPLLRAKIRGLRDVFDLSEVEQPKIGLLQPSSAALSPAWAPRINAAARAADALLSPGNRPYAVVFEQAIVEGRESLKDFRVLILPFAIALPRDVASRIDSWMNDGGHVWAIGPSGELTSYGEADGWLNKAVGLSARKPHPKGVSRCASVGRGSYCSIDGADALEVDAIRTQLIAEIDRVAPRTARADSDELGLITRVRSDGTKFLVAYNRDSSHPVTTKIVTTDVFARITDVGIPTGAEVPITRNASGGMEFSIELESGAGTVFELTPPPPAQAESGSVNDLRKH